jgi:hypothetical protein
VETGNIIGNDKSAAIVNRQNVEIAVAVIVNAE